MSDTWGLPLVEDAAEARLEAGAMEPIADCLVRCRHFRFQRQQANHHRWADSGAIAPSWPASSPSPCRQTAPSWEFEHDAVGWNDPLPNLNAALGVAPGEDLGDA